MKDKAKGLECADMPHDHLIILQVHELIALHFRNHRAANFYSAALNTELPALNQLLKTYLNKTITALVQERIHAEAERLLVNSTLSCKEIAFYLEVSDPPYFTRCFKKRTGLTPVQFREKYQNLPDLNFKKQELS